MVWTGAAAEFDPAPHGLNPFEIRAWFGRYMTGVVRHDEQS